MSENRRRQATALASLALLAGIALACALGGTGATGPRPVVTIITPADGTEVPSGQEVVVLAVSISQQGIGRVELYADGKLVHSDAPTAPEVSFTASLPWKPESPGKHTLQVRAYDRGGKASEPASVSISVQERQEGTLTPTLAPSPGTAASPTAITRTRLNVRAGPDTAYPLLGTLDEGQTVQMTGRNQDSTWWQIVYPPGSSARGWIAAEYTIVSGEPQSLLVISVAPPPPPTATMAPTRTETATVQTSLPAAPSDVVAMPIGTKAILVKWVDNADNEEGFIIRIGEEGAGYTVTDVQVGPDETSYMYKEGRCGLRYVFYVLAYNAAGQAGDLSRGARVSMPPCGTPPAGPDLLVANVSFVPSAPLSGQTITITISIFNQGTAPAGAFQWKWIPAPGEAGIEGIVDSLPAGQATAVHLTHVYSKAGAFETTTAVDTLNAVAESDEDNNVLSRKIAVSSSGAEATMTLVSIPAEDGYVRSDGIFTDQLAAGDDAEDMAGRAFFSFDLTGLAGAEVLTARLEATPYSLEGDPFGALGPLHLYNVYYGRNVPQAVDYNSPPEGVTLSLSGPTLAQLDATQWVRDRLAGGFDRLQVRLQFDRQTNGDGQPDYIFWNKSADARLTVTYRR
jgi:hypothetical protein